MGRRRGDRQRRRYHRRCRHCYQCHRHQNPEFHWRHQGIDQHYRQPRRRQYRWSPLDRGARSLRGSGRRLGRHRRNRTQASDHRTGYFCRSHTPDARHDRVLAVQRNQLQRRSSFAVAIHREHSHRWRRLLTQRHTVGPPCHHH